MSQTTIITLRIGHGRSRSGRSWDKWYISKAWILYDGQYVEANPNAILEPVKKDWYISNTKRYADVEYRVPVNTIIKYIHENEDGINVTYFLITSDGMESLEYENVREYLVRTPKVAVWYHKNIIKLPDGTTLVDVNKDPKLYSSPRTKESYTLSRLQEMKKELGIQNG